MGRVYSVSGDGEEKESKEGKNGNWRREKLFGEIGREGCRLINICSPLLRVFVCLTCFAFLFVDAERRKMMVGTVHAVLIVLPLLGLWGKHCF